MRRKKSQFKRLRLEKPQIRRVGGTRWIADTFRDALSEETRKARTYLLGLSIAGVVMVRAGLLPSQITAIGITFEKTDRSLLLFLCGLVTAYFLISFLLYGIVDFARDFAASGLPTNLENFYRRYRFRSPRSPTEYGITMGKPITAMIVVYLILFLQYILPVLLGFYSTSLLFARALH
jgi:hypothetical protein